MSPKPLENQLSSIAVVMQPTVSSAGANGGGVVGVGGGGSSSAGNGGVGGQQQPDSGTRGKSISLAMLFDFIIQRTYHELTTLADILPSKSDTERKIEIYNFSARTRQLFIRLLALVKWANSASKVDKSASIMSFLDKQSMLFVDTADMLARMARETLVHARLPNFHIHAAVEVLTTGNYARLPACIKEKIIPAEPITAIEKKTTLQRLNQVIQHRLVSGDLMPQMRKFKIDNGRVTFRIEHEFEVSMTLMGDGPTVPWRLLGVEILVEDKDTGSGKALVHPLQCQYIQQVLQARLAESTNALEEVYNCLHHFSQLLQLEVLFTQTLKLKDERLEDDVSVEEYVPGEKLTVAYWRELSARDRARSEATSADDYGFLLTVQTDPYDKTRPLAVVHLPSIGAKESAEVADRAVRTDVISMERLLVHTIYIRSLSRLSDVRAEFQTFLKDVDYHLQGTPAILTVPVLHPCLRAEQIHITVDTHTGRLRCHVPKHLDCPVIGELEGALNDDHTRLPALVSELRYWITLRRCEKTLQHLPATPYDRLPLLHAVDHPIARIGKHKLFVRLNRHPTVILVVEIKERAGQPCEMDFNFNLVYVRHAAIDDNPNADEQHNSESDIPKVYLRVQTLIEFDSFVATHGSSTCLSDGNASGSAANGMVATVAGAKRKMTDSQADRPPPAKQPKNPSYFIPELAHIVNMCDEKLPFVALAQELERRGIPHSGFQIEANASAMVLKLLALPPPSEQPASGAAATAATATASGTDAKPTLPLAPGSRPVISKRVWASLMRRLLTVAIRAHPGVWSTELFWSVEFVFKGTPLRSVHSREQSHRRAVISTLPGNNPTDQSAKTVDCLLDDWKRIVYLYVLVDEFVEQYRTDKLSLQQHICIKSYNYTSLLLGYGRNKEVTVKIFWCVESTRFRMIFTGGNAAVNAHSVMREQLQAHLNAAHNLAQIVHILHETYEPLTAVAKLPVIPHLGIQTMPRPQVAVLSFCILPQSPTTLKIVYQMMYCLEICIRGGGLVSIRDGAHSRFAKRNVLDEFTPTQGLQAFLSKYVDETTVYRRRSPYEDDNPPSPAVVIEDSHGGPGSVGSSFLGSMRGPQSPRDAGGLRFAPPLTPPTISNPLTPASPHHSQQQQQQQQQQQNAHGNNFGMTSPPSMPHPSPGAGLMPASPLNPLPSPMAAQSPGPNNLAYMQNHPDSSPFSVMSPAASGGSNWPGSPGMPRPSPRPGQSPEHKVSQQQMTHVSRVLPARSWAGATPTLLTDEALETLCRPGPHPQKEIPGPDLCPLERFLGCCFMRRHLQRHIQQDEFVTAIQCDQPGVVLFKTDSMHCQVFLNPQHHQSLHLKLTQLPPGMADQQKPLPPPFQWIPDDLHILERFFDSRVVMPPYRPSALSAFGRLLTVPPPVLRDIIQIMRLELMPEILPGLKWHVQFCMRPPPSAVPVVPTAVVMIRQKILFFLQVTRIPYLPNMEWKDCTSLVLPMVFDVSSNITQLAERRETGGFIQSMSTAAVSNMLRRFAEYSAHQSGECSIFPAVRELLTNLTLPNEPQAPPQSMHQQQQQQQQQHQQQQQQQMQNQIIPSPAGVRSSPSPMMHSPMAPQQQQQHQHMQQQQQQQQLAGMSHGYGGGGTGGGGPIVGGGMGMGQLNRPN